MIENRWSIQNPDPARPIVPFRVRPDTSGHIVVSRFKNGCQVKLIGPRSRYLDINRAGRVSTAIGRFSYGFLAKTLPFPISDLRDHSLNAGDLANLVGLDKERLTRALEHEAPETCRDQVFRLLTPLNTDKERHKHSLCNAGLKLMRSRQEKAITVKRIAETLGISSRYFRTVFAETMGLSPKRFMKIRRFECAMRLMEHGSGNSLTQIGNECGYFDQSHMIEDFHDLIGSAPGEYMKNSGLP